MTDKFEVRTTYKRLEQGYDFKFRLNMDLQFFRDPQHNTKNAEIFLDVMDFQELQPRMEYCLDSICLLSSEFQYQSQQSRLFGLLPQII